MTKTPQRIDRKELYLSSTMTLKHAKSPDQFFSCLMTPYEFYLIINFGETEKFHLGIKNFSLLRISKLMYLCHAKQC